MDLRINRSILISLMHLIISSFDDVVIGDGGIGCQGGLINNFIGGGVMSCWFNKISRL
jgi:hypothetical protein